MNIWRREIGMEQYQLRADRVDARLLRSVLGHGKRVPCKAYMSSSPLFHEA